MAYIARVSRLASGYRGTERRIREGARPMKEMPYDMTRIDFQAVLFQIWLALTKGTIEETSIALQDSRLILL